MRQKTHPDQPEKNVGKRHAVLVVKPYPQPAVVMPFTVQNGVAHELDDKGNGYRKPERGGTHNNDF